MIQIVDVFPIEIDLNQYPLRAFKIEGHANLDQVGGIYAHRVKKLRQVPCAWARDEKLIITVASFTSEQALELLRELWSKQEKGFDQVEQILPIEDWLPSPNAIAQFVAIGILGNVSDGLESYAQEVDRIRVCPESRLKGIVVDGKPALAISIHSEMVSNLSLAAFYREKGDDCLKQIGLMIRCKKTTGSWGGVVGKLGDRLGGITRRKKLLSYNPSDYDSQLLQSLPDDHLIVGLKAYNGKVYDYPIKVLRIVVNMGNLDEFGDTSRVVKLLRLSPKERAKRVKDAFKAFRTYLQERYPHVKLETQYRSDHTPHHFAAHNDIGFAPRLRFGNGQVVEIERDTDLLNALTRHGLYRRAFQEGKIQCGVVDAVNVLFKEARNEQLGRLNNRLRELGLSMKSVVGSESVHSQNPLERRSQLRSAIERLAQHNPDLIIIYLPDSERTSNEQDSLYNIAKAECIGRSIASQVIFKKTVSNQYADGNILMGILGKTGNIPYVLAEPLEFLDIVVGLDIGRQSRFNGGSTNMAAMSRIYLSTGELSGYVKGTGLVEGETLPRHLLESLFSREKFAGKRVAIHRDGLFRGSELQDLQNWSQEIGATFFPVEVVKSGASRMYRQTNGGVDKPNKGDVFYLSQSLAWLASSPPPFSNATAHPLQINNLSTLTREQAIRSVLALTLLHYGSLRPPRLPVSTHASDKIASFLLRNIQPSAQGDKPFWL